jgi:DNA repair protein RadD
VPELRYYQRACVDALFQWVSAHDGHPLVVIPTGGGKSLIIGTIIQEALGNAEGARALVLAHRKELIQQNVKAVASVMPLGRIGVYSAGLKSRDTTSPIIVAGIQSIARRPHDLGAFDLILIDEAHLVPTEDDTMYRKFIAAAVTANPHVRFIGLTATPYRLGHGLLHRGRGALFTDIAYDASVKQLIADGYLCRLISKATLTQLDTSSVATRGGEFVPGQLEQAVDHDDTNTAAVDEMIELFADRKKWLIFCAGVKHAEHIAEALRTAGVPAAAVHGEMPAEDRRRALDEFKVGALRAITSMDVLTTGYDEPAIDAIALLRPTKSTGLYVQMVGRGFRLHPSKTNTLVLDFAGNVSRHGPVDAIEIKEKGPSPGGEGATPTKTCPNCQSIEHAGVSLCTVCGFEFPKPERPPIFGTAGDDPILSDEPKKTTWHEVTHVEYDYHQPRDEEKPPSLRVEYYMGFRRLAMEWICLEHDGFARDKAERWWKRRSPDPVPDTVNDALRLVDELITPTKIGTVPDGRWTRVIEYELAGAPSAPIGLLPRACWSCGYWAEKKKCCLKWDAEPPADVQLVGCESWKEEEEVPF